MFIHLKYWPDTEVSTAMRERFVKGGDVKVVYQDPWYWKCSASRVPKPTHRGPRREPYIIIDDSSPRDVANPSNAPKKFDDCDDSGANAIAEESAEESAEA